MMKRHLLLQVTDEQMKHFKIFGWQLMHQAVDQVHPLTFVLLFCDQ